MYSCYRSPHWYQYMALLIGSVLGGDQEVFDGSATLEVSLDAIMCNFSTSCTITLINSIN